MSLFLYITLRGGKYNSYHLPDKNTRQPRLAAETEKPPEEPAAGMSP